MRILCLDIGSKRIGVAVSDPLGLFAQPLKVIERKGNKRDFEEISKLCGDYEAKKIVVGLPLNEEGETGQQAAKIKMFVDRLKTHLSKSGPVIPIEMWDERYSTRQAEERLIDADVGRKKRKRVIDKMAALVILEDYLKNHSQGELCSSAR